MREDPISFWLSDGIAWSKPSGDCCDLNATKMKEFAKDAVRRGYREFVVDLEDCTGIDETFMGTLVGAELRLRELKEGRLRLIRCPAEIGILFRDLGLDQLIDITSGEVV